VSEDLTGRRIGHYRIDAVLGRGGMSVMYRATDVRLGRQVALKVMGENLTGDAEFRERFVDEARNTSAIDHPNVVPLYDFGEVDGLLFIAMRLVDGADLATLVSEGPMTPTRTIALLAQVAEALDMLHDRGLVHLDVKPANVLVTNRESSTEHVYLADFGLTRRGATGHRTRGGDFLGSPTYAAPEHLRGEPVDGRTDEYALTCVLFACLTGRAPFQGAVPDVISGHLGQQVPSVAEFTTGLPPAIDAVIRKGTAKDQTTRYPDCRSLIAAARIALSAYGTVLPPTPQPLPGYRPAPQQQIQQQPQQQAPQQPRQPPQPQRSPYEAAAHSAEPMRLRPPVPAGASAFTSDRNDGTSRWVIPVVIGVVAVIVIVVLVVVFSGGDGGSGSGSNGAPTTEVTTSHRSTLPTVAVGGGQATDQSQLPTNFPATATP
jgi:serine/threonine-protein kinase